MLHPKERISAASGDTVVRFAFIASVAPRSGGSSFLVADPRLRRVVEMDSAGLILREYGRSGAGPGEFVAPIDLAASPKWVAVLDVGTARVSLFSNDGSFVASAPAPQGSGSGGMIFSNDSTLLMSWSDARSSAIYRYRVVGDSLVAGQVWSKMIGHPPVGAEDGFVHPGGICARAEQVLWQRPWDDSITVLSTRNGEIIGHLRLDASELNEEMVPSGRVRQGAYRFGLVCDDATIAVAWRARTGDDVTYAFLDSEGESIARFIWKERDPGRPGRLVAIRGRTVLTHRADEGEPYIQEFELGSEPRTSETRAARAER